MKLQLARAVGKVQLAVGKNSWQSAVGKGKLARGGWKLAIA
jgi:hypothetical protein